MNRGSRLGGLAALFAGGVAILAGAGTPGLAATDTTEPTSSAVVESSQPATSEADEPSTAVDTEVSVVESTPTETTGAPVASLPAFEPQPIEWTSIGEGVEEGWLEVPIDYADPEAGTFRLYLVRHLAADPAARIGSLLVNPGGPGVGGTYLAEAAEFIYSPDLVDSFDIVAWDPRGTGHERAVPRLRRRRR